MLGIAGWLAVILFLLLASLGFALAALKKKQQEPALAEAEGAGSPPLAASDADLVSQIIANEKATWEATKNKDRSALAAFLAEDYREVSGNGVRGKAEAIQTLEEGVVTDYWMEDVRVAEHDKQVAVITYKVRIEGIYKGQRFPPKSYYTTSIWMNRDGKWQAVLTWAPN